MNWSNLTSTKVAGGAAVTAAVALFSCSPPPPGDTGTDADTSNAQTFNVRITNNAATDTYNDDHATGGNIWITPGAWAVHTGDNPIYSTGEAASSGLSTVAESGKPGDLANSLQSKGNVESAGTWTKDDTTEDPNDPTGSSPGAPPVAPQGQFQFTVSVPTSQSNAKLSFASMYVPSNDIFISTAKSGIELVSNSSPIGGNKNVTNKVRVLDAGSEVNEQPGWGPNAAPSQGNPDDGEDQAGEVTPLDMVDDGFEYPDSPKDFITVKVEETSGQGASSLEFTVTIKNASSADGFYRTEAATAKPDGVTGAVWLTPGAWALHAASSNPIYATGASASAGLESVAEAGKPGGTSSEDHSSLVDELRNKSNVVQAGRWGPGDTTEDPNDPQEPAEGEAGAPPIAKDGVFEFQVTAEPGQKLTFASMYVPSNDIFFAPKQSGIELFDDDDNARSADVTSQIGVYDAGTEKNQKPGFGPLSAPLQENPGDGIDEDGNVRSISNVDDGFSYTTGSDLLTVEVEPAN